MNMFGRKRAVIIFLMLIGAFVIFFIYQAYIDSFNLNCQKSVSTDYSLVTNKFQGDHKINHHDLKPLLLPTDQVLDSMNHTQLFDLYWRSNFQFDFELAVMRNFHCEIHTFDPSKKPSEGQVPKGISFHLTGLGRENFTNTFQWKMDSFSNIRKSLNHTTRSIDILKIDIEGDEWEVLSQMLQSGDLKDVKQLCIEIHFAHVIHSVTSNNQLKVLRKLYEHGFHIFMRDRNLVTVSIERLSAEFPEINRLNEISLININ